MHSQRAFKGFASLRSMSLVLARAGAKSIAIGYRGLYCSRLNRRLRQTGVVADVFESAVRIARFVCDRGALMSIPGGKRPAERTRDKLSLLRNHSLFRDLPPAVIEHLGSYMKTRRVARENTIFEKGDPAPGLRGVLAGTVKVSVAPAEGKDIVLTLFHEGEVFGEIALLDGRPRTADAVAMSDCELVVIERRDFVPFLSSHPDVMLKFIEILCSRL